MICSHTTIPKTEHSRLSVRAYWVQTCQPLFSVLLAIMDVSWRLLFMANNFFYVHWMFLLQCSATAMVYDQRRYPQTIRAHVLLSAVTSDPAALWATFNKTSFKSLPEKNNTNLDLEIQLTPSPTASANTRCDDMPCCVCLWRSCCYDTHCTLSKKKSRTKDSNIIYEHECSDIMKWAGKKINKR